MGTVQSVSRALFILKQMRGYAPMWGNHASEPFYEDVFEMIEEFFTTQKRSRHLGLPDIIDEIYDILDDRAGKETDFIMEQISKHPSLGNSIKGKAVLERLQRTPYHQRPSRWEDRFNEVHTAVLEVVFLCPESKTNFINAVTAGRRDYLEFLVRVFGKDFMRRNDSKFVLEKSLLSGSPGTVEYILDLFEITFEQITQCAPDRIIWSTENSIVDYLIRRYPGLIGFLDYKGWKGKGVKNRLLEPEHYPRFKFYLPRWIEMYPRLLDDVKDKEKMVELLKEREKQHVKHAFENSNKDSFVGVVLGIVNRFF